MYFACEICTRLTLLFHSNGDLVVAHSSVVVLGLHLLIHLLVTIRHLLLFHFSKIRVAGRVALLYPEWTPKKFTLRVTWLPKST
jgi:hypothetical protein